MRAPISPADAVQPNEFSVSTPSARRVLVIDDDRDVADSLAMLLDVLGCDVRTAYSGAVGVSLVSDFQPRIVFLDLGMPEMNGYETARRIRSEPAGQQAQLIALTGWGQDLGQEAHPRGGVRPPSGQAGRYRHFGRNPRRVRGRITAEFKRHIGARSLGTPSLSEPFFGTSPLHAAWRLCWRSHAIAGGRPSIWGGSCDASRSWSATANAAPQLDFS